MLQRLAKFFSRHRNHRWIQRADRAMLTLHRAYENLNYDIASNGELRVIERLATAGGISTVFDVGANRGDWSALAAERFPGARIHAFEIVPDTFKLLHQRVGLLANVAANDVGLSDTEGTVDVFFSADKDFIATCVSGISEEFHHYKPEKRNARVTTGDRYCTAHGVERINFLKIDVEGFEPQVLKGFKEMLGRGAIEVVQFEYGYVNIDTHFLLKDFYALFAAADMTVGKIYPDRVEFRPYQHVHEDFYGPNYLAVKSSRQDLIERLGRG